MFAIFQSLTGVSEYLDVKSISEFPTWATFFNPLLGFLGVSTERPVLESGAGLVP